MKQATFNKNTAAQRVQHMGKRIYNIIGVLIIVGMLGYSFYSIYHIASFNFLKFNLGNLCIIVFGLLLAGLSEWIYNKHNSVEWDKERSQFCKYLSKKMIRDIAISTIAISVACLPVFIM